MKSETQYLAIFGLFLTLVMATTLFAMVGLNPKLESYDTLPWIYAGTSAMGALGLWYWARRIRQRLDLAKAK